MAVPTPTTTASTRARSRCRCTSPAGPLMYFECPDSVATRPSSDWPIWPTITRSSTAPLHNGSNRSAKPCGSSCCPLRNAWRNSSQGSEGADLFEGKLVIDTPKSNALWGCVNNATIGHHARKNHLFWTGMMSDRRCCAYARWAQGRRGQERRRQMSWPAIRSGSDVLRTLVIGVGLCWSIAFVAIALTFELQLYADGAMFSYAVAVRDVWAFHWHNISGRSSVFLLSLWPAETYVGLSGSPGAGIVVYGLLFYLAPLAGLIATFAADRSRGRAIFVYACASTALLCPLVFGFPTEMWLAHALFWPALAVSHYAKRSITGTALVPLAMLALAFTHEGALALAIAIVATLAPRGWRDALFWRAAAVLIVVLAAAAVTKIMLPPDEYYAGVLLRAALH